MNETTNFLECF